MKKKLLFEAEGRELNNILFERKRELKDLVVKTSHPVSAGIRRIITTFFFFCLFLYFSPSPSLAALGFTELGSVVDSGSAIANSYFGQGMKTGDINGDGYQDLVICSPGHTTNTGRLYVFFGGSTLDTATDLVITGEATSNYLGCQPTDFAVADIDKDGYDDLVFGAMYNAENGTQAGKGYLFFGSSSLSGTKSASLADVTFAGNTSTKKSLGATTATGNFNGDGNLDIAFSAIAANTNAGAVLIYFGNGTKSFDNTVDKTLIAPGSTKLGNDSLKSGDINGDGYDDVLVGERYFSDSEVYLFYGGSDMDTTYDVKFTGAAASDYLSNGISDIKDLDHDGYLDICLGASMNDTAATNAGRIYCFWGSSSLSGDKAVSTDANLIISGSAANDSFGSGLFLYDVNNDGNLDLIVGAYQWLGSANGYVKIYLGNGTKSFDTTADVTITAADIGESGKMFGYYVSAGDLDNDGWSDLFLTSVQGGNGTGTTGKVHIFEVNHGTPVISLTSLNQTNQTQPTLKGRITDSNTSGINISKVQWSFENHPERGWFDCTSDDGSFESLEENFSCFLNTTTLGDGQHTVYVRSLDINGLYSPLASYATNTFTVKTSFSSTTSSSSVWTNSDGALRTFSPSLANNLFTTNNLPSFKFTKAGDNFSSITKYQILIKSESFDWKIYLDDIPHNFPSGTILDEEKRNVSYSGETITVYAKGTGKELTNGAYLWKVKAFDNAGNTKDSEERTLLINTHQALFSSPTTFFPLVLLNIGGSEVNFSSLDLSTLPKSFKTKNSLPTFYGISSVNSKITLTIKRLKEIKGDI